MKNKTFRFAIIGILILMAIWIAETLRGDCCTGNCCCVSIPGWKLESFGCVCKDGALLEAFCNYTYPVQ